MDSATGYAIKLKNVDFLRFIAASIVVLSHISLWFPISQICDFDLEKKHFFFRSVAQLLFNGPAAVMLFFVVSGICINAPYTNNRPLNVSEFYVRRYVRIAPPLLAAYLFSLAVGGSYDCSAIPVVWSLWCEAIYYLLFPAILAGISKFGFKTIFLISCVATLLLSLVPDQGDGHAWNYGPFLTWIIFLPVWLSGLWIAENMSFLKKLPPILRTKGFAALGGSAIFGLSMVWTILRFHVGGGIKYPLYMMLIFAIAAAIFVFLLLDIDLSGSKIIRFLDRQGRWSYSLYLVHYPILFLATTSLVHVGIRDLNQRIFILLSLVVLGLAYLIAILFYQLVEKPSHELAKRIGRNVGLGSNLTIRRPMPTELR